MLAMKWRCGMLAMVTSALLSACGAQGGTTDGDRATPPASNPPAAGNSAPRIWGAPGPEVIVGNAYSFTPSASDADSDTLAFSISGKPAWATFNTSTGRLSGRPGAS